MYDPERDEIIYQRLIWIFKPIIKLVHKKQNKHNFHWVMITSENHRNEIEATAQKTLHCKSTIQRTYASTGDVMVLTMMVKSTELASIFALVMSIDPNSTWKDWDAQWILRFPRTQDEIKDFNKSSKIPF